MKPTIVKKDEMILVGIATYGGDIEQLWGAFEEIEGSIRNSVPEKRYELHIYPADYPDIKKFHCMVAVEVEKIENLPQELFVKILPACKYAVFTHKLADGPLPQLYWEIEKWFKGGDYIRAHPFDILCFDGRFKGNTDPNSEIDVLVPVKSE